MDDALVVQMRVDASYWKQQLEAKEHECEALAETITNMSAALLGVLLPGMPFSGNATSVTEAMRLRRALFLLAEALERDRARGRYDIDAADVEKAIKGAEAVAAEELLIVYAPRKEPA